MVRMNDTMSDNLAAKLDALAAESEQSKSEIFRKALTLFEIAHGGTREGKRLALVNRDGRVATEFVGL